MNEVPEPEKLVDGDVVSLLEEWLDLARQGRLRGVVIAGALDGGVAWNWRGFWRMTEAVGALEFTKHAMLTENYNQSRGIENED